MRINWNEPRFSEDEIKEVTNVLNEAYLNEGPRTKLLEDQIKEYLDVKHVILTTSATAALFLAIKADAKIKNVTDFEVIVPDMTMIASATSVNWAGGEVKLVDVEKEKMTIDLDKIEEKITDKTTAIMPVHILGRGVNMGKLSEIAKKHNLTIIEDAAGALGSKQNGKYLGTFGKVGCFSLQSNKIISTGQGGIIVTDDREYYEAIRRLRDFGRASNKEFLHDEIGYNLKFNDLTAAVGLKQFEKIEKRKEMLVNQYNFYKKELKDLNEVSFPFTNIEGGEIPLWIDIFAENPDKLIEFLKENDIHCRKVWPAIHQNKPYNDLDSNYPNSSFISKNVVWLPNGPAIDKEIIKLICEKIKQYYS